MSVLERIEKIKGGITAPRGFSASGVIAGIKPRNTTKKDVAIIFSEQLAVAAGTFTTNQVKAAPVRVSQRNIKCGEAYAIIANSGNANACTGVQGVHDAQAMVQAVAEELGAKEHQILVCSTGRIGVPLPMPKMIRGIKKALKKLSPVGSKGAAEAIMTSDTVRKEFAIRLKINNKLSLIHI